MYCHSIPGAAAAGSGAGQARQRAAAGHHHVPPRRPRAPHRPSNPQPHGTGLHGTGLQGAGHRAGECSRRGHGQHDVVRCRSTLDRSLALARARLEEMAANPERPLVHDPFAAALCAGPSAAGGSPNGSPIGWDAAATHHVDQVLTAVMGITSTNTINSGDYNQVVLLGDALATQPFRMLWPPGTLFFLVAGAHAHAHADSALKGAGAAVPSGCLLRRVHADLGSAQAGGPPVFLPQLQRAGFQAGRLSAWGVQGLDGLGPPTAHALLAEAADGASYHSVLAGELPAMTRREAENMLAEVGWASTVLAHEEHAAAHGRAAAPAAEHAAAAHGRAAAPAAQPHERGGGAGGGGGAAGGAAHGARAAQAAVLEEQEQGSARRRWLFTAQQTRLSLAQVQTYEQHVAAAEEVDEDFFGNFS